MRLTKKKLLMLSALVAQAGAGVALAQDSSDSAGGLEEVVVTATRRATDVQDTPLAITAITGEGLEKQNVEGLEDLTGIVPNILLAGDNGGTTGGSFYMRGIPNVGVYLDGIWQVSNNGLLTRDFVDLDRIEVLRGPQGTLYGRDSTGGSIHIHTKAPASEFGVKANLQVGNLDRRDVMVSVDLPIGDKIFTKWTISDNNQDGWVKSLTTGIKDGYMRSQVRRGDILFKPTEQLSFRVIHQEDDQVGRQARVQARIDPRVAWFHGYQVGIAEAHDIASGGKFNPNYAVAGFEGGQLGKYESRSSSSSPNQQYLKQTTVHADWDVTENVHVKYMLGNSLVDASVYNDWGGSQYNFFVNYDTSRVNLTSHELQLSGDLAEKVEYSVGFYHWKQKNRNRGVEWSMQDWTLAGNNNGVVRTLNYDDVLRSPACQRTPAQVGLGAKFPNGWPIPCNLEFPIAPGLTFGPGWIGFFADAVGNTSDRLNQQTQNGNAYFGEATWHVTDRWDLTAGYRHHSQDNEAFSGTPTFARPIALDTLFASRKDAVQGKFGAASPVSFGSDTLRFATTFDINDDVMVYGGYSEGFNSGGISQYKDSAGNNLQFPYAPEDIRNYEVGLRADLLNRRLRANVTAFRTDWLGIQYLGTVIDPINGQEATELILQNSADGKAQGAELEATWLATDALQFGTSIGLLKTNYTNTDKAKALAGTAFARAPKKTYMLNAQYKWQNVFGGDLTARASSNYWGAYWRASTLELRQDFQGLQNKPEAGDVWMHNANLTWAPSDGKYELSVWGSNLTNSYSYNSGFMHGIWQFDFATVDRPREFGINLKARF
jgi:iron complex outermembrane recepter protein